MNAIINWNNFISFLGEIAGGWFGRLFSAHCLCLVGTPRQTEPEFGRAAYQGWKGLVVAQTQTLAKSNSNNDHCVSIQGFRSKNVCCM